LTGSNRALRSEKAKVEQLVDEARDPLKDLEEGRNKLRQLEEKEVKNRHLIAALQQKDEQNQNELKRLEKVDLKFYSSLLNGYA
jgi:hypothetical protein